MNRLQAGLVRRHWEWGWMALVALLLGVSAQAAKTYSFSGKVSKVSSTDFEVTQGAESREFGLAWMAPEQRDQLRVGEEVTVWYSMEAQSVGRQQPGRASGAPETPRIEPDESLPAPPAIQDDRAFYNAKIEWSRDSRS